MMPNVINEAARLVKLNSFIKNSNQSNSVFPNSETSLDSKKMQAAYKAISAWPQYKATEPFWAWILQSTWRSLRSSYLSKRT
jgi:hypothetical protein